MGRNVPGNSPIKLDFLSLYSSIYTTAHIFHIPFMGIPFAFQTD